MTDPVDAEGGQGGVAISVDRVGAQHRSPVARGVQRGDDRGAIAAVRAERGDRVEQQLHRLVAEDLVEARWSMAVLSLVERDERPAARIGGRWDRRDGAGEAASDRGRYAAELGVGEPALTDAVGAVEPGTRVCPVDVLVDADRAVSGDAGEQKAVDALPAEAPRVGAIAACASD